MGAGDAGGAAVTDGPAVLGLDLSINATGVAGPDGLLATISPPKAAGDMRIVHLRDALRRYIDGRHHDLVAVEGFVVRTPAAAMLGMLQGVLRADLLDRGIPFVAVPPATLKVYATGRGNATKADMRMALFKRTGLDEPDDNRVDAAWLRLLGLDLLGAAQMDLPKDHRRALDKIALPAGVGS